MNPNDDHLSPAESEAYRARQRARSKVLGLTLRAGGAVLRDHHREDERHRGDVSVATATQGRGRTARSR
jgi:hypothetical protein